MACPIGGNKDTSSSETTNDQQLKLAVAISLLRSKLLRNAAPHSSESEALLRWKLKAKERKQEILMLSQHLKEAQVDLDAATHCDLFPQTAACKCYFFHNFDKSLIGDASASAFHHDSRFNDVLRRRFLRQVRFKERQRADANSRLNTRFSVSLQNLNNELRGEVSENSITKIKSECNLAAAADFNHEDEKEQLRAAVDFLVEICDKAGEAKFANWAHQAVDFVSASLKNLLTKGKNIESVEDIVNNLIVHLVRRMCCSPSKVDDMNLTETGSQFYIQHIIRKLGSEPYVGQRVILSVSLRISELAGDFHFRDPFDDAFPNMHGCMFIMIQLIEFLISDYLVIWSREEDFDHRLFNDWVTSIFQAQKAVEMLENRNGLYVLYMDRIRAGLAKIVNQVPSLLGSNPEVLKNLFC
ncbi:hypothetical protein ACFE04_008092 [Oxalis oulophora]